MILAHTLVARLPDGTEKRFRVVGEAPSDMACLDQAKAVFFDWLRENNATPLRVEAK